MTDDTRQKIQDGRYRTEDREVTVWDQVGVGVLVFKRPHPLSEHILDAGPVIDAR